MNEMNYGLEHFNKWNFKSAAYVGSFVSLYDTM